MNGAAAVEPDVAAELDMEMIRHLATAVLERALTDAVRPACPLPTAEGFARYKASGGKWGRRHWAFGVRRRHELRRRKRIDAIEWITSIYDPAKTFELWCAVLGVCPAVIRSRLQDAIDCDPHMETQAL